MERVEADVGGEASVEPLGDALDLGDAGEEGEHPALLLRQRAGDRGGDLVLDPERAVAAEVAERQRVAAALALDHRRVSHQAGEARAVERRRHRDEAQVGAERALHVERQREADVAVEAALVDLVEQHRGDAGELGIGLDARDEDALGDHRDAGGARAAAVHAGRVAEGAADLLAREPRHPLGRGARGEAAGGEEEDLARAPVLGEERGRDGGGLAGAGRRDEHGVGAGAEGGEEVREDGFDRERGHQGTRMLRKLRLPSREGRWSQRCARGMEKEGARTFIASSHAIARRS